MLIIELERLTERLVEFLKSSNSQREREKRREMGGKRRRGGLGEKGAVAGEVETHNQQSSYEAERNAMLDENKRRMMELGLLDASNLFPTPSPKKKSSRSLAQPHSSSRSAHSPPPRPGPRRRSSRLQGTTAVSYKDQLDDPIEGKKKRPAYLDWEKPEIYTEEDEKKLGSCEKPWELFKDGVDENGARIYDSANGKTCHQCRQKTLGFRTSCSSCNALQGQFCGDCIFMRYGENVLETLKNQKWVCPICRGICNCSLCRPKRGWPPTGSMYKKAIALGYKSVAHYLILTRRAESVS